MASILNDLTYEHSHSMILTHTHTQAQAVVIFRWHNNGTPFWHIVYLTFINSLVPIVSIYSRRVFICQPN